MICGECKFHTIERTGEDVEWCCNNIAAEDYGMYTPYDYGCEDGEEKE